MSEFYYITGYHDNGALNTIKGTFNVKFDSQIFKSVELRRVS